LSDQDEDQTRSSADRRTDLAADRTDWAKDRTVLAKQRTYAAWVRTGLAALAVGFAGTRLLGELEPQWLVRIVGGSLIVVSGVIFLLGFIGYRATFMKLRKEGMVSYRVWVMGLITAVLVLASLAGLIFFLYN